MLKFLLVMLNFQRKDSNQIAIKEPGKSTFTEFFKKGKYQLRAQLEQIPGGRFAFSDAPPVANPPPPLVAPDPPPPPPSSPISICKVYKEGGDIYLLVEGSGSVKVDMTLKTSDTSSGGEALTELRIGDVRLKRSSRKEKISYHPDG